jgi:hypothetical protein
MPTAGGGLLRASQFLRQVQFGISANLQELAVTEGLIPLECPRRRPRGEGDFTPPLREQLSSDGVVLEVWGFVDSALVQGQILHRAQIHYALFPVCTYTPAAPGVRGFVHTTIETAPGASPSELLARIKESEDLRGYALASLGLRALQQKKYDLARTYFCGSTRLLSRPASGRSTNAALLQFVKARRGDGEPGATGSAI